VSDEELASQAASGDDGAFGALVERHGTSVYRACLAALGTPSDAEDAAQEAFLLAHRRLGSFRGEARFKTWLLAIAWRRALDHRRSLLRRLRRFVSGDAQEGRGWLDRPAPARDPEGALLDAELAGHVRRLVGRLPAKLRDPLLLSAAGEHSYEEMAEILDVPAGTLKWRVSEARRLLKRRLAELGYGDE
jgi:RNA polymerase sigma-70 factor (ECF subfamily)